jgi:formate hydrogenlyase transcriptional activator
MKKIAQDHICPHERDNKWEFKDIFLEICTSFINLTPAEIDREIEKKLRLLAEFRKLNAILLLEMSEAGKRMKIRHFYVASDTPLSSVTIDSKRMPWLMTQISNGETLAFSRPLDELPEEAEVDKAFIMKNGIRSVLAFPLKIGEAILGGFIILSFHADCSWSGALLKELNTIGEVFASAMDRKRTAEWMVETGRFERLLSVISTTYINLPPGDVDNTMRRDLGRLGRLLRADRCILYLPDEDGRQFTPYLHSGWWPDKDHDIVMKNDAWIKENKGIQDDFIFLYDKWHAGEHFQWTQHDMLSESGERMKRLHVKLGTKSHLSVPISVVGKIIGALTIADNHHYRKWPDEIIPRLRIFGEIFANALARKQSEESLHNAFSEIKQLKKQIEADYIYLREEIKLEHNFDEIAGESQALKEILLNVERVASVDATVLILGETGTGKELIARAIHSAGNRSNRPLIKVNCAALSPNLIESELFGHEKGSFTGAGSRRTGRFELANGATLFLDEIGELPLLLQAKLLQVLQDGTFERVGGSVALKTDARVLAATNRDIRKEVEKGKFRRDLFYRLNAFPISIPPLRERTEDIPVLVKCFVEKYSKKFGRPFTMIPQKTMNELARYPFPGNVRELENMIERAIIASPEGRLHIEIPAGQNHVPAAGLTIRELNREYILKSLHDTGWVIEGPKGAARMLGVKPSTLRNRMDKLGIIRPSLDY